MPHYYPPASTARDACTIQKFFELTTDVVRVVLDGLPPESVDFPMKPSPTEWDIIRANPNPPASLLLRGRSGTGKTTCLVYRMWNKWLAARDRGKPFKQGGGARGTGASGDVVGMRVAGGRGGERGGGNVKEPWMG